MATISAHPIPVEVREVLKRVVRLLDRDTDLWNDAGISGDSLAGARIHLMSIIHSEDENVVAGTIRQCSIMAEYIVFPMMEKWSKSHPDLDVVLEPKLVTFMANELMVYIVGLFYAELIASLQEGLTSDESLLVAMAEVKETAIDAESSGFMDKVYDVVQRYLSKMSPEESSEWMKKYAMFQRQVTEGNSGSSDRTMSTSGMSFTEGEEHP